MTMTVMQTMMAMVTLTFASSSSSSYIIVCTYLYNPVVILRGVSHTSHTHTYTYPPAVSARNGLRPPSQR